MPAESDAHGGAEAASSGAATSPQTTGPQTAEDAALPPETGTAGVGEIFDPEASEEAASQEGAEQESMEPEPGPEASGPEEPVYDQALLGMAAQVGLTEEDVKLIGNPIAVENVILTLARRMSQQPQAGQPGQQAQAQGQAAQTGWPEWPDGIDAGFKPKAGEDPEFFGALGKWHNASRASVEHARERIERMESVIGKIANEWDRQERLNRHHALNDWADGNELYRGKLGQGKALGESQKQARAEIAQAATQIQKSYELLGQIPPSWREACQEAAERRFTEVKMETEQRRLAAKANAQHKLRSSPPAGQSAKPVGASSTTPARAAALRVIKEKQRQHGLVS